MTKRFPAHSHSQGLGRIPILLAGNALVRIGGSAGGILIGLHFAEQANQGRPVNETMVGALGAVWYAAELVAAIPIGILADTMSPRILMILGSLLGTLGVGALGVSRTVPLFFTARDDGRCHRSSHHDTGSCVSHRRDRTQPSHTGPDYELLRVDVAGRHCAGRADRRWPLECPGCRRISGRGRDLSDEFRSVLGGDHNHCFQGSTPRTRRTEGRARREIDPAPGSSMACHQRHRGFVARSDADFSADAPSVG